MNTSKPNRLHRMSKKIAVSEQQQKNHADWWSKFSGYFTFNSLPGHCAVPVIPHAT